MDTAQRIADLFGTLIMYVLVKRFLCTGGAGKVNRHRETRAVAKTSARKVCRDIRSFTSGKAFFRSNLV